MKYPTYMLAALATVLTVGCNERQDTIDDSGEPAGESTGTSTDEEAGSMPENSDARADIEKARIQADRVSEQAQLEADKKKAQAEANAAKARVDAENQ